MANLNGQSVQPSDCVKLLGVRFDDKSRFRNHIFVICPRASRQIDAINRVSKFRNKNCKVRLYDELILSNFLYCLSPSAYKMDKTQKRVLRVVFTDYLSSYKDLLKEVNRQTLYFYSEGYKYGNKTL